MMELDGPNVDGGARIEGEVFRCDERTVEALDILEGVRDGRYYQAEMRVAMHDASGSPSSECLTVTAYFYPATQELMALEHKPCYTDEDHALYAAAPDNQEILALLRPAGGGAGGGSSKKMSS